MNFLICIVWPAVHKKCFPSRISSVNVTKCPTDLVTFSEEILNGKLHFLCNAGCLEEETTNMRGISSIRICEEKANK